jgi:hypothetical protein
MNKKNNNLITFVMYYSLFHKQLINNQTDIINFFPKNVFGIFSTIRRALKIKSYPIDVHGCIGYWDINFNTLNKTTLYNNLLRVAYDSVWKDTRNHYFPPIESEPETTLELDFMLNPIYSIDKNSGIIIKLNKMFTNKNFGIIIQTMDKGQKATYLPNVFPNISWRNMIVSLKNKANITSDNFELFAYKITQIKSKFINILTGDFFSYICIFNFSRLLINNMKLNLKFPFMYSCKNNMLEWNANDNVRNISTLSEIFKYINLYPDIATKTEFKNIKQKVLYILQNIDQYDSQSLSFLGYIYQLFNINNELFCKKLLQTLPFAENEFEKPEIIIGLNNAGCNLKEYSLNSLTYNSNDTIFKMNWIIQSIISFNKTPSNKLIFILEKKIDDILKNKKYIETNYLAVAFEALCFIYARHMKITLLNKLFELLFELEQRKNCYNVLYAFLDKTSRVDITGHIINGLVELRL